MHCAHLIAWSRLSTWICSDFTTFTGITEISRFYMLFRRIFVWITPILLITWCLFQWLHVIHGLWLDSLFLFLLKLLLFLRRCLRVIQFRLVSDVVTVLLRTRASCGFLWIRTSELITWLNLLILIVWEFISFLSWICFGKTLTCISLLI